MVQQDTGVRRAGHPKPQFFNLGIPEWNGHKRLEGSSNDHFPIPVVDFRPLALAVLFDPTGKRLTGRPAFRPERKFARGVDGLAQPKLNHRRLAARKLQTLATRFGMLVIDQAAPLDHLPRPHLGIQRFEITRLKFIKMLFGGHRSRKWLLPIEGDR